MEKGIRSIEKKRSPREERASRTSHVAYFAAHSLYSGTVIYQQERAETALYMRRLYERYLTTCSGGNISCRTQDDRILITVSSVDKATLQDEHIAVLMASGENLTPELKTSTETAMHLAVFRNRPDVDAVVHAHPVYASLYAAASERKIRTDILAEARYLLGEPVLASYALMGTNNLAEIVGESFRSPETHVVLMENHGVITVGKTLHQAYDRMEVLEAAARMTFLGFLLGDLKYLSLEQSQAIDALHDKMAEAGGAL